MWARRLGLAGLIAAILVGAAALIVWMQSDPELDALNGQIEALIDGGKHAGAMPLALRSVELTKTRRGEDHPLYAVALNNLAVLLRETDRLAEAEPLYRRALAIDEKNLGTQHPNVALRLGNLAVLLRDSGRLAEAESLLRRALSIDQKSFGSEHPGVARDLTNLAVVLRDTGGLAEAERLDRRALEIAERNLGPNHPQVGWHLNSLAELLRATNRLAEAEPLYSRALAIDEKSYGPDHPAVALHLNNLALLLEETGRVTEAEALMRRALAIDKSGSGPDHPRVARRLNNLAELLRKTNQPAEAESVARHALAIDEKSFGSDHPNVARDLTGLAALLWHSNRLTESEPPLRRALAIDEGRFGPGHFRVAADLNNLAVLLRDTNRLAEAEPLMRRALAIDEKSFGSAHPFVAIALNNLAVLRAQTGDWVEAAEFHRRAIPIMTAAYRDEDGGGLVKAALVSNTWKLRASARAVYRADGDKAGARDEGFGLAQWALQTGAADALTQMAVRFAKGGGPLSGLVRERQDLMAHRQGEDKRLLAATGRADASAVGAIRAAIAGLDSKLGAIDKRLGFEFPEYAQLSNPTPLTIATVQSLLAENEALIVFLDVPHFSNLPEETLVWGVTRQEARWLSIPLGTTGLAERVAKLRCGLDRAQHWAWSAPTRRWEAKDERCRALKPDGLAEGEPLPFDFATAHELYAGLLAPFADLTRGRNLIIVPSGALTSLPLHVLVTESPSPHVSPAWLALQQAITVLPSVGSLAALRRLPPSQANEPYLGFGNPLLDGDSGDADQHAWAIEARAKQSCTPEQEVLRHTVAARGMPALGKLIRGGVNVAALRAQMPLPETADEVCSVARSLGALGAPRSPADTVWLGARATEGNLKALSHAGKLARYRLLHFATHGVVAGESEAVLKAKAEPALILTPPRDDAIPAELEEDDGLLNASEVAQLNLDADWVVLSACNTAAGDKSDAEALSGLARAFFYAKARTLVVSHWSVSSQAAVKLTTGAFDELGTHAEIGRAEALRRSMTRLIASSRSDEVQPEYWAPFVLVGEGAR